MRSTRIELRFKTAKLKKSWRAMVPSQAFTMDPKRPGDATRSRGLRNEPTCAEQNEANSATGPPEQNEAVSPVPARFRNEPAMDAMLAHPRET